MKNLGWWWMWLKNWVVSWWNGVKVEHRENEQEARDKDVTRRAIEEWDRTHARHETVRDHLARPDHSHDNDVSFRGGRSDPRPPPITQEEGAVQPRDPRLPPRRDDRRDWERY
jgi:hypothetical protein